MSGDQRSHRGTILLTIGFVVLVVTMWLWMYLTLLGRG